MIIGFVVKLIGFGAKGIIANSIAAVIQSRIGLVKARSLFAKLTSLTMRGFFKFI